MATKRKKTGKKKTGTKSRRKVGAMALNAQSPLVMLAAAGVGFLMGDKINTMVDKVTGTMNAKVVAGIETGLGAGLVFMKLGKKKTMVEVIAGGLIGGAGIKRGLREFGIINGIGGYQSVPVLGRRMIKGYGKVPVLGNGGYRTAQQSVNGVFNGYEVPRSPASSVMGSTGSGSGLSSGGSSCMG
jgi:hypothetical protein